MIVLVAIVIGLAKFTEAINTLSTNIQDFFNETEPKDELINPTELDSGKQNPEEKSKREAINGRVDDHNANLIDSLIRELRNVSAIAIVAEPETMIVRLYEHEKGDQYNIIRVIQGASRGNRIERDAGTVYSHNRHSMTFGIWENEQCDDGGTGWHAARVSSCNNRGEGTLFRGLQWVDVEAVIN